jgi:cytochrome c-type biogenesis protein CcmH
MSATIDQLKQQISQIDELARTGALSAEQATEARTKLEKQLVEAVMTQTGAATAGTTTSAAAATTNTLREPPLKVSRKLVWGMAAFVLAVGAGGYKWLGHPEAWGVGPGEASTTAGGEAASGSKAPHTMGTAEISAMVDSLKAKLAKDPKNADGWGMLARTYAALERFDEAVKTYRQALSLRPDDPDLLADFADAQAMLQGRKLDGEPAQAVAKALKIDPKNFKARSLSGTIAFERGDFKQAAEDWGIAVERVPADNPQLAQQLRAALAEARQKAGLPPLAEAAPGAAGAQGNAGAQPVAAPSGAHVSGTVSLSPALKAQVSPEDTVFIFARAANGPKMPLAIVRKQVKDLPVSFSLDDSMAMSPQMKLSGFPQVIVGARVSRSGQAMPQEGDFAGQSDAVKVGSEGVKVEIASAIKLN